MASASPTTGFAHPSVAYSKLRAMVPPCQISQTQNCMSFPSQGGLSGGLGAPEWSEVLERGAL